MDVLEQGGHSECSGMSVWLWGGWQRLGVRTWKGQRQKQVGDAGSLGPVPEPLQLAVCTN